MREALRWAETAIGLGEAPIACVIAERRTRRVVGWGWNERNARRDRTAHAEMVAFRDAAGRYDLDDGELVLVSTLEPCIMCLSACIEAAVREVVWALPAPPDAGAPRVQEPDSPESRMPRTVGGVMAAESRALFERWLTLHTDEDAQRAYVTTLLRSIDER